MAVHNNDPNPSKNLPPPSDIEGQWDFFEDVDDRMPQFNGSNLSSVQLAGTTADDGGSGTAMADATAQMGRMDIGKMKPSFDLEGDYDMTHYAGSNNSGPSVGSGGVETDHFRPAPAVQGSTAPGPLQLTTELLGIHTRQTGLLYTYPDSPGGWVQRTRLSFLEDPISRHRSTSPRAVKKPPTSNLSEASSAWIPVPSPDSDIDVAGAGEWAKDTPAPPHHRRRRRY